MKGSDTLLVKYNQIMEASQWGENIRGNKALRLIVSAKRSNSFGKGDNKRILPMLLLSLGTSSVANLADVFQNRRELRTANSFKVCEQSDPFSLCCIFTENVDSLRLCNL